MALRPAQIVDALARTIAPLPEPDRAQLAQPEAAGLPGGLAAVILAIAGLLAVSVVLGSLLPMPPTGASRHGGGDLGDGRGGSGRDGGGGDRSGGLGGFGGGWGSGHSSPDLAIR